MGLRPSKSKIPSFRPIFYFFYFSYSQKNPKKFALVLFDFKNKKNGAIFMILFDRFLAFFT